MAKFLIRLGEQGAEWVQLDEPILVKDQPQAVLEAASIAYDYLAAVEAPPKNHDGHLLRAVEKLPCPYWQRAPIEAIGVDLTPRGGDNLEALLTTPGH